MALGAIKAVKELNFYKDGTIVFYTFDTVLHRSSSWN